MDMRSSNSHEDEFSERGRTTLYQLKDVVVHGASMGRQIGFHVTVLMTSVLGRLIDGSRRGEA